MQAKQLKKEFPDELFQEHQPRQLHVITLQPDRPELPTPESKAAKASLLASLDATLNLADATLHSVNYNLAQSNSAVSISIVGTKQAAEFVKSLLPHYAVRTPPVHPPHAQNLTKRRITKQKPSNPNCPF